jgi:hypothetical protein
MRHPFVTAGRRAKSAAANSPYSSSRLVPSSPNVSSRKLPTETPKKSQISAPTPLAARKVPTTPVSSSAHMTHGSSVKSYRTSQPTFHSGRAVNGIVSRPLHVRITLCANDAMCRSQARNKYPFPKPCNIQKCPIFSSVLGDFALSAITNFRHFCRLCFYYALNVHAKMTL